MLSILATTGVHQEGKSRFSHKQDVSVLWTSQQDLQGKQARIGCDRGMFWLGILSGPAAENFFYPYFSDI